MEIKRLIREGNLRCNFVAWSEETNNEIRQCKRDNCKFKQCFEIRFYCYSRKSVSDILTVLEGYIIMFKVAAKI